MIKEIYTKEDMIRAFSSGYELGHHDTVEGQFSGNGNPDYHRGDAEEWLNDYEPKEQIMTNYELRKEYEADLTVLGKDAWKYWESRPDVETEQNTCLFPWCSCEHPILWEDDMEYRRSPDAPSREEWETDPTDEGIPMDFPTMSSNPLTDKCGPGCKALDVLCVIHRDGGHYISEHGIEKASEDAIKKLYQDKCAGCRHTYEPDIMENNFFECPYDKIVKCRLEEPCFDCEVFIDYTNKK